MRAPNTIESHLAQCLTFDLYCLCDQAASRLRLPAWRAAARSTGSVDPPANRRPNGGKAGRTLLGSGPMRV